MIVKKLNDVSGGGFPGARYNEKKIADGVATLMAMENVSEALRHNVETLHRFGLDASAEVERYLKDLWQYKDDTFSVPCVGLCERTRHVAGRTHRLRA